MSLLAQAQELKVEAKTAGPQQTTKVMTTDIDRLQAFAGACEAQFPKLSLNENAIKNGGLAPIGDTMVPFAATQKAPNGSVTVATCSMMASICSSGGAGDNGIVHRVAYCPPAVNSRT